MLAQDYSTFLTRTATLRSVATGALLFALCAASLGCALAAFISSSDDPTSAPPHPYAIPVASLPLAQPLLDVADPARCSVAPGIRARPAAHGKCRVADLPPA